MKRRLNRRVEQALMATSGSSSFTLGGALRAFLEQTPLAHHAQISAVAAGDANVSLTKQFCAFLVGHDFDASVIVGVGYTKALVKPCPKLLELIRSDGEAQVAYNIQHAVVKVGGIVFDLTFLRLGDTYSHINNFPLKEFNKYFREVRDMRHVMGITPEHARELARKTSSGWTMGRQALAQAMNTWYFYDKSLPVVLRTKAGLGVKFEKGQHFSVFPPLSAGKPSTVHHVDHPDIPLPAREDTLAMLLERSRPVLAAPSSALRPPQMIRVDLSKPSDEN